MSNAPAEIDWEKLDKQKFIVIGTVLFSGVSTCLFPLSVIKTRQMAIAGIPPGFWGVRETARSILGQDGIRGLYRGFGTVMLGAVPARVCYLSTLELVKSATMGVAGRLAANEAQQAGIANFVAGASASLVTQSILVPIDVISQRLMVAGRHVPSARPGAAAAPPTPAQQRFTPAAPAPRAPMAQSPQGPGQMPNPALCASPPGRQFSALSAAAARPNGITIARTIVQQEGLGGLYRGFGASIATFVPSSAVWWSAYGAYQKAVWHQLDRRWQASGGKPIDRTSNQILSVQTFSGMLAGCTSAALTNPLDVVKTRLQVATREQGDAKPNFRHIAQQLVREEGLGGFYRGIAPRCLNTVLFGTCMVNAYELLKRLSVKPDQ